MTPVIVQLPSGASVLQRPIEVVIYAGGVISSVIAPAMSSRRRKSARAAPAAKAA